MNYYVKGSYDQAEDFEKLNALIKRLEKPSNANRLFYLALPPNVYQSVTAQIHAQCMAQGYVRKQIITDLFKNMICFIV